MPPSEPDSNFAAQDDEALALLAQQGNGEAFDALVLRYQGRLRGFSARFMHSAHDVNDLVQDAFLAAYRGLGGWKPERAFAPWLWAILRNHLHDALTKRARQPGTCAAADALLVQAADQGAQQRDDHEQRNVAELAALATCLQHLSNEQRLLLQRRYVDDEALESLAATVKRTPTALAMLLMRLRTKVQDCVAVRLRTAGSGSEQALPKAQA